MTGLLFVKGMKWPKVMPNVKNFSFDFAEIDQEENTAEERAKIFVPKYNLITTFPKLRTVKLCLRLWKSSYELVNCLKQLNPEDVPNFYC